jgi:hypothetical protein
MPFLAVVTVCGLLGVGIEVAAAWLNKRSLQRAFGWRGRRGGGGRDAAETGLGAAYQGRGVCQTGVRCPSSGTPAHVRFLKWPLWGVLTTGATAPLLVEHGSELFQGHSLLLVLLLLSLPVIGGILTPEKPEFTIVIFAVGSVPPLNDIPPIPIGLWPFLWIRDVLSGRVHITTWYAPFLMLAGVALSIAMMSFFVAPLVGLGWWARGKRERRQRRTGLIR